MYSFLFYFFLNRTERRNKERISHMPLSSFRLRETMEHKNFGLGSAVDIDMLNGKS